jgi:rare lipoprotein A (peptidoglycan hydrolase)
MANGKPLNDQAMTCAMWITGKHGRPLRPDGRLVRVRNVETGKSIVVRWTDNGPGPVPRAKNVAIDLTPAAFEALGGKLRDGKIKVKIEPSK